MNFEKIKSKFFKETPIEKDLRKIGMKSQSFKERVLTQSMEVYKKYSSQGRQEQLLKGVLQLLQQKGSACKRTKIMLFIIQMSKRSKYDIAEMILNRKIKALTRPVDKIVLDHTNLDKYNFHYAGSKYLLQVSNGLGRYVRFQLLIPLFNYLMKLSSNQELYNTCKQGSIPEDQIFRRGTKIRFIWIFKIYNLIQTVMPIVSSVVKILNYYPEMEFLKQAAELLYEEAILMNNYVITALQEAANDNYLIMPYLDMLQFNESLTQQLITSQKLHALHSQLAFHLGNVNKPRDLKVSEEEFKEIELQALRVKLISNSLKNPKKDFKVLQTQYHEKTFGTYSKNFSRMNTDPDKDVSQLQEKYKHLD